MRISAHRSSRRRVRELTDHGIIHVDGPDNRQRIFGVRAVHARRRVRKSMHDGTHTPRRSDGYEAGIGVAHFDFRGDCGTRRFPFPSWTSQAQRQRAASAQLTTVGSTSSTPTSLNVGCKVVESIEVHKQHRPRVAEMW